jgi:hypothetical protein
MIPKLPGHLDPDGDKRKGSMVPHSHRDCHRHRLSDHAALPSHRYQPLLVAYLFLGDGLPGVYESWLCHDEVSFGCVQLLVAFVRIYITQQIEI